MYYNWRQTTWLHRQHIGDMSNELDVQLLWH